MFYCVYWMFKILEVDLLSSSLVETARSFRSVRENSSLRVARILKKCSIWKFLCCLFCVVWILAG